MITSPYNFVPLSEKVVMPFWAKHVSHDIPFKDSESGILELKLKAASPIYVRNGVSKDAAENDKNAFNNINNKYFIPGSSIKGMLRSVMEIMSFGRMGNKVNDHRYSVRDFQNDTIYPKSALAKEVLCGWLFKKDGEYFLDDCGKPGRISHKTLDSLCKPEKKISAFYKTAQNITPQTKSAKAKYEAFPFDKYIHKFILDYTDVDRPIYKIDSNGKPGTIVFSGQPGVRIENEGERGKGKHLEFIFFNAEYKDVPVEEKTIQNFFFAYHEHDRPQQKEDWKWRKEQLDKGEKIPVFFRVNNDGSIKDMGLSLLYKITYNHSIKDAVNLHQKEVNGYDLAETIFGYTEKNDSLKGRVHVGHAFAMNDVIPLREKSEVLAGPKASYYPNYIEQSPNNAGQVGNYKTFMDESAKVRGWKRYPIRNNNTPISTTGTDNVKSKFCPLPAGTEFTLSISYHNLRKEELGAVISAITFHNTSGLFHSIGSGKPLGYGKASITITNLTDEKRTSLLKAYELFMDYSLEHSTPHWSQSLEIKELLAMAKAGSEDGKLKYMELNDFVAAKGKKKTDPKFALQRYSFISNNHVDVTGLVNQEEFNASKKVYDAERKIFETQFNIGKLKSDLIEANQIDLESALKTKKRALIELLHLTKETVALKQQEAKTLRETQERIEKANSGIPPEWYNISDFNNLANRIPKWQKKLPSATIPEAFKDDLIPVFKKIILHELTDKKTIKSWQGDFENIGRYKTITGWIGELRSKAIYNDVNQTT